MGRKMSLLSVLPELNEMKNRGKILYKYLNQWIWNEGKWVLVCFAEIAKGGGGERKRKENKNKSRKRDRD